MWQTDKPLWMPAGSVRSLIALSVVAAFIAGLIEKDVVLMVLGFYFATRTSEVTGG